VYSHKHYTHVHTLRMHCSTITMLLMLLQVKCHQYWPQVGSVSYGIFTVTLVDSMEVANYCCRTLRLSKVRTPTCCIDKVSNVLCHVVR